MREGSLQGFGVLGSWVARAKHGAIRHTDFLTAWTSH